MESAISLNVARPELTLGALLRELGPDTALALGNPDPARTVTGSEFHDALDPFPTDPGLVVLAPSLGVANATELAALLAVAAQHGTAALAVKCRDRDLPAIREAAASTGVAVLRVADRVSWRLFDALIAQAFGEHQHREDAARDRGAEPLFVIANELATAFGGSVAIEDLGRRIVAYSSVPGQLIDGLRTQGILTRRVPDAPANDDQYRTVLRTEHPVVYPRADGDEARIAIGVRAGTLPLGTIWVISPDADPELTPAQSARIQSAATVAAAHMLDDVRSRRANQLPREDRLRTLLDGAAITGSELAELGLPEERGAALLVLEPAARTGAVPLAQLRSTLYRHLALHRPETVAVVRDDRVYALIQHDGVPDPATLATDLLPLLDRLIGPGTRIALPGIAHRSGDIAPLRELAVRLLAAATRSPQDPPERVLTVPALRARLAIDAYASVLAANPELRAPELEYLCAADPATAATLAAWCAHFGNVARSARELGVHENTVRHRIKQATEQYGVRLKTADDRLAVWLQLRSRHRTAGSEGTEGTSRNTPAPTTLNEQGA